MRTYRFRALSALFVGAISLGLTASASLAQTTYGPGPGGPLVDATLDETGVFESDIVISGTDATVTAFNSVTLTGLTHSFIGDLEIVLTRVESGESVILASLPEDEDSDFDGTYTFVVDAGLQTMDEAAAALTGEEAVPSGSYAISDFGGARTDYTILTNTAIDGTWRLTIEDFGAADTGELGSWQFSSFVSTPAVVPEAGTLPLMATALFGGIALVVRRRNK